MRTDQPEAECRLCGGVRLAPGLAAAGVPANPMTLFARQAAALRAPRGDIALAQCADCGFVFNAAFRPELVAYDHSYESSQIHSATFRDYSLGLAQEIAADCASRTGAVLEIGCGQGEFLRQLRDAGCPGAIGVDPAFDPARTALPPGVSVIAKDFDPDLVADRISAIVCKMTLEHVPDPARLLRQIACLAGRNPDCRVWIQVPNSRHMFANGMYWDVIHEHVNYFVPETLASACARAGLAVRATRITYSGQHLMVEAVAGEGAVADVPASHFNEFNTFCAAVAPDIRAAVERIDAIRAARGVPGLWGAGSKAVSFMAFAGCEAAFACAIDIHPLKAGTFLPGSGLAVLAPGQGETRALTDIFVMNPIYRREIEAEMARTGLTARLHDPWTPGAPVAASGRAAQIAASSRAGTG